MGNRKVVVGHWQDPSVQEKLGTWVRAAMAYHDSRGAKIARVAVMRKLATIMWHMLHKREAWQPGSKPKPKRRPEEPRTACEPIDRQAVSADVSMVK